MNPGPTFKLKPFPSPHLQVPPEYQTLANAVAQQQIPVPQEISEGTKYLIIYLDIALTFSAEPLGKEVLDYEQRITGVEDGEGIPRVGGTTS